MPEEQKEYASYLLQVQATHMDALLGESVDLSTERGTSALMLDAIAAVDNFLERRTKDPRNTVAIRAVSKGASVGVWTIDIETFDNADETAKALLGEIRKYLKTQQDEIPIADIPFSASMVKVPTRDTDPPTALLSLAAAAGWQALQNPGLFLDALAGEGEAPVEPVCALTHTWPAQIKANIKGKKVSLAASVYRRRVYGRDSRRLIDTGRSFYDGVFKDIDVDPPGVLMRDDLDFPLHFESICEGTGWGAGKIAVLYADGNGFGRKRDQLLAAQSSTHNQLVELERFDMNIRKARGKMLREALTLFKEGDGIGCAAVGEQLERGAIELAIGSVIRFETLLWGGDELVWIMPARKGLPVAKALAEVVAPAEKFPHALGLVLCDHRSPIRSMIALASQLADLCKREFPDRTAIAYETVTSFDHAESSLEALVARRCTGTLRPAHLVLPFYLPPRGNRNSQEPYFKEVVALTRALKDQKLNPPFSRRRLRQFVRPAGAPASMQSLLPMESLVEQPTWNALAKKLEEFRDDFGPAHARAFWHHAERLWDAVDTEVGEDLDA